MVVKYCENNFDKKHPKLHEIEFHCVINEYQNLDHVKIVGYDNLMSIITRNESDVNDKVYMKLPIKAFLDEVKLRKDNKSKPKPKKKLVSKKKNSNKNSNKSNNSSKFYSSVVKVLLMLFNVMMMI